MNASVSPMLPAELNGPAGEPFHLWFQVLYEDIETGLRAKKVIEWLEADLGSLAELYTSWWRFDLLEAAHVRELIERATATADILLVSAHGQEQLPEGATQLIDSRLERGPGAPPALVALLDNSSPGAISPALGQLEHLARKHGADFFPCSAVPTGEQDELCFEGIRYRAETITSHCSTSHREWFLRRNWGINE